MPLSSNPQVHQLLAHILCTPTIPMMLKSVHDLALYESGEASIGADEKESLQNTAHLADLIEAIPKEGLHRLINPI
jgi:hypothetical protein